MTDIITCGLALTPGKERKGVWTPSRHGVGGRLEMMESPEDEKGLNRPGVGYGKGMQAVRI